MARESTIRRAVAVLLFLLASGVVRAAPPSISGLTSATRLSEDDIRLIQEYSDFWLDALRDAAEDPDQAREARRELVEPLRRGGTTDVFRNQYWRALEDGLEKLIDESNPHVGVTALIVMSQVGTERALEAMVRRSASSDEPRRYVRLAAARGSAYLIAAPNRSPIRDKDLVTASRELLAAARDETDHLALRYQTTAILVASENVPPDAGDQVRGYLVEALEATARRAAVASIEDDPVGLLDAVYPVVNMLRSSFIQLAPPAAQQRFGQKLGPALRTLLDVATTHWNDLQSSPEKRRDLGQIIYLCEQFLKTIDRFVRADDPPNTRLKQAWDEQDADRYRSDLQLWNDVLTRPPYK